MKLLVLCNDRMALPALGQLLQSGLVRGVGMTGREGEVKQVVKSMAAQYNVPLQLFTKNTFAVDLRTWLQQHSPDAVLVKTFPWKIPAEQLDIPHFGFINFHYAPLPQWGGANPLFWMVRNGAQEAGVTIHRMEAEMDKGPIIMQQKFPMQQGTTFGMLTSRLAYTGVELTGKLLQMLMQGTLTSAPQQETGAGWYNRPVPADLCVDWENMTAEEVACLADACNPWNKGAVTSLGGWMLGITYVTVRRDCDTENLAPGTILSIDDQEGMLVVCKDRTVVRVDIIYSEEGFMPGWVLSRFGMKKGMKFTLYQG